MRVEDEDLTKPWHLDTYIDEHGHCIVPAFTLTRMQDEEFVYWAVNLHNYVFKSGAQVKTQLFHTRELAECFITEHKRQNTKH
jgi:hypothetical protein